MLYKETIETGTLELLKELQSEPLLAGFNLVGGTSLALRIGHRKSVDLDLFSSFSFDQDKIRGKRLLDMEKQ
ncbi:MAG: nucleotidyl transferase AbiEii/AbiGii toxin family protein, partial [Prevotella sp.]